MRSTMARKIILTVYVLALSQCYSRSPPGTPISLDQEQRVENDLDADKVPLTKRSPQESFPTESNMPVGQTDKVAKDDKQGMRRV